MVGTHWSVRTFWCNGPCTACTSQEGTSFQLQQVSSVHQTVSPHLSYCSMATRRWSYQNLWLLHCIISACLCSHTWTQRHQRTASCISQGRCCTAKYALEFRQQKMEQKVEGCFLPGFKSRCDHWAGMLGWPGIFGLTHWPLCLLHDNVLQTQRSGERVTTPGPQQSRTHANWSSLIHHGRTCKVQDGGIVNLLWQLSASHWSVPKKCHRSWPHCTALNSDQITSQASRGVVTEWRTHMRRDSNVLVFRNLVAS